MATTIQFLRSDIAQQRPNPSVLANGMPMVNYNQQDPGLYFKARDNSLLKIGPTHVGPTAPNSAPAGYPGNSVGEMWLDTASAAVPVLRIWDGSQWVPFQSGQDLFQDVTIQNSLTVLGTTKLNDLYDYTDSFGNDGDVFSKQGGELRWRPIRTQNVIYVAKNGDDANDGLTPLTPKLTIKAGLAISAAGYTVQVAPGDYTENNPLVVPAGSSVCGYDLRTTTIYMQNDADLFHVNNGCYISQFSFRASTTISAGRGIVAFPPTGAGNITKSPYVQNCTNFVANSTGLKVDGSLAGGLRSMVLDAFTQFNPNGIGAHVYNLGYTQLVSMFTICSDKAVYVQSGGLATASSSVSDFGNYGLYADGVSALQFSGDVDGNYPVGASVFTLKNLTSSQRPYVGQVVTIGALYYNIIRFDITNQGFGYTSTPTVSVQIGTGPQAIAAQGVAIVENGFVTAIELVSSGQNYTAADTATVTITGGGGIGAAATAVKNPVYYTIAGSTPVSGGACTISLVENLPYAAADNDDINFYQVSRIVSNSHGFEWIGTGTNIATCLPQNGGVAVQANQVVQINGGRVSVTSTDELGDFRVGEDLVINQNTGTISGTAFTKSILATVTPFILALS